jgi:hypothetical protein
MQQPFVRTSLQYHQAWSCRKPLVGVYQAGLDLGRLGSENLTYGLFATVYDKKPVLPAINNRKNNGLPIGRGQPAKGYEYRHSINPLMSRQ